MQDLAQHPGRVQAGELRQVDGRLGVAGPLEDASLLRHEREDVAGHPDVRRP
jgi:hypothetical protein